ncbi:carboxypeptidase-like regulatory domain-containing protein [Sediminibacter sp. Hel_I_10]|uniref:carboxypeptidase-like regulatory domain-containing protein n=1 Tax=Sediminibacter sp. Hel_I_10 TaxID=1392490 RepID=UPI00047B259F|nr:carboxypeptidase-like regulatory domain-containing protein [Sediminibacter sp. Hel_I_10]
MKRALLLFVLTISTLTAFSQSMVRTQIHGKIIVENSDVEGITIFNTSSDKGVVTDEKGEFDIDVKLNDLIEVRALQYQNFNVQVNEAILESKRLRIFLIEQINKLDEILVMTSGLTGELQSDVEMVKTFNPKLDALYFGIKKSDEYEFSADPRTEVDNEAMHSQMPTMVNGLNIVNVVDQLLLPLFRSGAKDIKDSGVPEVPETHVRTYMGSEYLVDNFGIPKGEVNEFIAYVYDDNFNYDLLNYGNEMEFLEFLNTKSKQFLKAKGGKN